MTDKSTKKLGGEEKVDIVALMKKHIESSWWMNESSIEYSSKELHSLLNEVIGIFRTQDSLVNLAPPCTVVGDIHGQFRDLWRIIRSSGGTDNLGFLKNRYVFLGDYVDRGENSTECITFLFSLKIISPKQFMLLRGNHETKSINYVYGFREELENKFGEKEGVEIWEHFNEAFSWMPLAGLVGKKILCMHGGISPHLTSLDEIRNIKRPLVSLSSNKLAIDLLWSDPVNNARTNEKAKFIKNDQRGLSVYFNETAVMECVKRLNIQLIIRAHQVVTMGYQFLADQKLLTIFSAPNYADALNRGAVLKIAKNGNISIMSVRSKETRIKEKDVVEKIKEDTQKEEATKSSCSNLSITRKM